MMPATLGEISSCANPAEQAGRLWAHWELLVEAAHPQAGCDRDRIERIATVWAGNIEMAQRSPLAALAAMERALLAAVLLNAPQGANRILAVWGRLLAQREGLPELIDDARGRQQWAHGWAFERAALDPRSGAAA